MTNLTLWMLHSVPDLTAWRPNLMVKLTLWIPNSMIWLFLFPLVTGGSPSQRASHDDVIKWKHFPRYWPFVRGIHRPPGKSPHKGQWRGALMFTLICAWINGWGNNDEGGDLRRHRAHYDVIVMMRRFDACLVVSLKSDEEAVDLPVIERSWHVSDVTVMVGHSWWLCCSFIIPTTFRKFELKYNIWLSRTCENVFCRMAVIMFRFEYLMKRLLKSKVTHVVTVSLVNSMMPTDA